MTPLVLASASPRRSELLGRLGLDVVVDPADVDESRLPGESAEEYVLRVSADKAHAVERRHPGVIVVAADTAVVVDGEPLGKPLDSQDALDTLERLSGSAHEVLSSVVVIDPDGIEHAVLARAVVRMAPTEPAEREWYVATGEPMDKAGSYAVQGIGAFLVEGIDGDPTTVIGLPLRATVDLLRVAGLVWPPPD
ncbi:MAG: Maf family protein [Actinomycetota bacterium]|nr:Maf family protein [Actinomycetota bacterium]